MFFRSQVINLFMTLLSSIIHYAVMLTSYGLGTRLPAKLAGIVMCGTDELCEVANIAAPGTYA